MAEDSELAEATSPQAPVETAEVEVDFGTDLLPDKPTEPASETSEQSQPESQESTTTDLQTDEGGSLRFADYTRKMQDISDQRRSLDSEQDSIRQERKRYQDMLEGGLNKLQTDDPVQQLYTQLGPEEQAGLRVVEQLTDHKTGALQQSLDQQSQTINYMYQQLQQMQNQHQSEQSSKLNLEVAEARQEHGNLVDTYGQVILKSYGTINPTTNDPYTISELVSLYSGQTAEKTQNARNTNAATKAKSKRSGAVNPGNASTPVDAGSSTESEALDEIESLGL
tara:strand:+ start:1263 stop:2105 length:843 start_codon:yes stop_codon:yes gene_type:complete